MPVIRKCFRPKLSRILVLACFALVGRNCRAQDAEKEPDEASRVAIVEVSPAHATSPVGGKLEFKAVAKDASGRSLPDAVKYWFAAPVDAASADQEGEVSFVEPGEITIGAVIGKKIGYAHVSVAKPHMVRPGDMGDTSYLRHR